MWGRPDPGECPICGAAHCACGDPGLIVIPQLPARDAAAAAETAHVPLVAELVQETLAPGAFTSATYRGTKKRP